MVENSPGVVSFSSHLIKQLLKFRKQQKQRSIFFFYVYYFLRLQ